jgi:hypothetical protein
MHIILWVSKNQIAPISLLWTQQVTCSFLIDTQILILNTFTPRVKTKKANPVQNNAIDHKPWWVHNPQK